MRMASFAALCLAALPSLAATPIKVFLLAGQSNMSGWTVSTGMPSAYTQSQANVLIYADGEIDNAKKKKWMNNGMDFGHAAGYFGPELVFGKTLSDSLAGTKIALIKHSVGSTYLATDWRPPSSGGTTGSLFNAMLATVKSCWPPSIRSTPPYGREYYGCKGSSTAGTKAMPTSTKPT